MAKNKIDFNSVDLGLDNIDISTEYETINRKIKIQQLDDNPENSKIYEPDEKADGFLKEDIRRNGLMNPIVVVKSEIHASRYTIVSGHRRTRIFRELGETEIEARELIVITPEEKALAKIMLITANSTQRDRKPSEKIKEIQYLKTLIAENEIENVAKWISKATQMSERNVYRYEKLAAQPKDIKDAVDNGALTIKEAIGERRKSTNENSKTKKGFDINKASKKVQGWICDIEKEFMKKENTSLSDESVERLLACKSIIERILN